ncbi:glutaredoxin family protein [Raineyella sp. W15-4]|uniref:glutaredoxin family protein n=1 Tax=Raineyella sp. W15-4 TaxID=3081651 RepID=UPI0029537700|nr:glutaredoxin family protein [Raineyella sp. W15-4]WOQ16275.1 glutaredoxin family protein [Raineyella sp. W15-4]
MTPRWIPRWGRPAAPADAPARVRVLSRAGCHLCVEAIAVVDRVCARHGEAYDLMDVDDDPALRARYGDLVPVVFVDGAEVATWRVTAEALDAALARPRTGS